MRFTKLIPGASLVLALAVAGCGDSTGGSTITITQAESIELFSEIAEALAGSGAGVSISRTGSNLPTPSLSVAGLPTPNLNSAVSISATVNCSPTGTVAVSGSVTGSENSGSWDITETFTSCRTTHFTLGGSLEYTGSGSGNSTSVNVTQTMKGDLTVSATDGRSGTCHFDFTVTVSGTAQSASVTASGTICGNDASVVVST